MNHQKDLGHVISFYPTKLELALARIIPYLWYPSFVTLRDRVMIRKYFKYAYARRASKYLMDTLISIKAKPISEDISQFDKNEFYWWEIETSKEE